MPEVTKKELIWAPFSLQNEVKNRSKIEVGQKGPKRGQKGPRPFLAVGLFGPFGPWGGYMGGNKQSIQGRMLGI